MKYLSRFLALFCLLVAPVAAWPADEIQFGVKGGVSWAKFSGDDVRELGAVGKLEYRTGLTFGGFACIPLSESISFQPELLFHRKGAREVIPLNEENLADLAELVGQDLGELIPYLAGTDMELTAKLDYLEIPLLVRFTLPASGMAPYFFAGPYLGLSVGSRVAVESMGVGLEILTGGLIRDTDLGAVFGAGVQTGRFLLEARYALGMASCVELPAGAEEPDLQNKVFGILAGVAF